MFLQISNKSFAPEAFSTFWVACADDNDCLITLSSFTYTIPPIHWPILLQYGSEHTPKHSSVAASLPSLVSTVG